MVDITGGWCGDFTECMGGYGIICLSKSIKAISFKDNQCMQLQTIANTHGHLMDSGNKSRDKQAGVWRTFGTRNCYIQDLKLTVIAT